MNNIRLRCKSKYKHAIRTAYNSYEKKLTDEMYDHFVHKNIPEFWKCWNTKFRKNVNNHVNINGCTSDVGIANAFADHFAKVYYNSHVDCTVKDRYQCVRDKCKQVDDKRIGGCIDGVSVELIDKCIRDMKKGKACDDLSAEHLLYAHPYLVVHLNILFKAILLHGSVPDNFGAGFHSEFVGCLLYADDIILLSPFIVGLQRMLDKCFEAASVLSLQFNACKSHCIAFGKTSKFSLLVMVLGGTTLCWSSSIKYLGVYLLGGSSLKFDIMPCLLYTSDAADE